jgi:hypothetical protein
MSVPLANYTLTYAESSKGWPSFYSFEPEYIKGMNQYLYTFKGGNMYRHNINETRNQFYEEPVLDITPTSVQTVMNQDALTSKVFKTIQLESSDSWKVLMSSDIQGARVIESSWFEKKEGDYFAYVRGGLVDGTNNFSMRSANGIGAVTTVAGTPADTTLTFPTGFQLGSIISIGDHVYSTLTPTLAGEVIAPLDSTSNVLHINTTIAGTTIPSNLDYILYLKNQVAESHGMLGHYALVTLTNDLTTATEMMAIKVDIMKSYP